MKAKEIREMGINQLENEVLFYGGILITVCGLITAGIYFCVSQIDKVRLKAKLDAEYGESGSLK